MKVKILVEFEVETELDDIEHGELTESRARSAASEAAYQHLCFTKNIGFASLESIEVDVDGFGECTVRIGEDHE